MPRRIRQPHPSTIIGGEPTDGESWNDETQVDEVNDEADDDEVVVKPDRMTALEAEITKLREDNNLLKRAIPPAEPRREEVVEDDTDWDELLFSDPKEALRRHGEAVAERVKTELRAEYTKEQGTTKFWTDFDKAHGDLKGDRDLVEMTLGKNMAELANLPVPQAIDRLADLTRDRIMGYTRRTSDRKRSRAVAEGAAPPRTVAASTEKSNVTTLGDLLKARRNRRRGVTAA